MGSKTKDVRVRIAPSPTGFAHVGTAYTALFNFAFAKKNDGTFIIRLEDTDIERNVEGAEEAIYSGLSWLGFDWDEGPDKGGDYGPYRQSERLDIYKKRAEELLKKDLAYEDEGAVRFRNPGDEQKWTDLIRGEVSFPGKEITDFVLIKSNGYPTYNFAVVVDDLLMQITHVIRGEEHISNTPRQLALYEAFEEDIPEFAHLPTLRNKERKKLSKRRDPVDLRIYREKGYLPEALVNFLCLLGWSHPEEKEIFGIDEFIKLFDIKRVRKAGPIFDTDKLDWLNKHYLQELEDKEFIKMVNTISKYKDEDDFKKIVKKAASLVKPRISVISEFDNLAGFFFEEPKVDEDILGKNYEEHLNSALDVLENLDDWEEEKIDKELLGVVEEKGFKTGDFFMDLRIAITGMKVTPPINDSIFILGKKETTKRLKKVLK